MIELGIYFIGLVITAVICKFFEIEDSIGLHYMGIALWPIGLWFIAGVGLYRSLPTKSDISAFLSRQRSKRIEAKQAKEVSLDSLENYFASIEK